MGGLMLSVGGSVRCAPTKTFATKSPDPPTFGSLWHELQAIASGPAIRENSVEFSGKRMVGFESPVAPGRPAPSCRLNFALKSRKPIAIKSSVAASGPVN